VVRATKTVLALAALLLAAAPSRAAGPAPASPRVLRAVFSGTISPVAAEYLGMAVGRAQNETFDALVIELDTPGGLDLSMREIVKSILASNVPVIVYVSPAGARAASAGVFITMAAHVAAMTPGTNIGAAHPVALGGGRPGFGKDDKGGAANDQVLEGKIENDAAAYLKAIASRRDREVEWSALFVTKSTSVTSARAVAFNVIDLEAGSLGELLAAVDGKVLKDFKVPLRTKGAEIVEFKMTRRQEILAAVSDPNIAMILMSLGATGILLELYSPGLILPGLVGAVSLILAFYSFQTLSVSFAGILFIAIGFLLYILELKIASFGLLALSGTAAILFGYMMLFKDSPGLSVSKVAVLSTVGTMAVVLMGMLYLVKKTLFRRSSSGVEDVAGEKALVSESLAPAGMILWRGELWRATSLEGPIAKGDTVVVDKVEGLSVTVRKIPPAAPRA
jgi:membrane-bound serine protease (ClpP class)